MPAAAGSDGLAHREEREARRKVVREEKGEGMEKHRKAKKKCGTKKKE